MKQLLSISSIACLLLMGSCGPGDQTSAATPPADAGTSIEATIPVEVAEVERRDISEELQLTGIVEPKDEYVVSSEIPGRVTAVHVDKGDWVKKGQLLFELDREKRTLELQSRRAELSRAEVQLEFARKRSERAEALLKKGAISQSEVDALREQMEVAESSVRLAHLGIETIERELEDTRILSPVDGQVAGRSVSPGETVSPSSSLIQIIDLDPVRIITEVAEPYLGEIRRGQTVQMTFDALPGTSFQGQVTRILPVANMQSGAFPIEIQLPNRNYRLLPGMVSRLRLTGRTYQSALLIPLESILHLEGSDYIYVVYDDRARRIDVIVRHRVGSYALVEANLNSGQKVVTRGNSSLTEGARVEIVSSGGSRQGAPG
ncbi:MAG TPA: efflux RND transporter periplasmic adaptor subunit [Acidobacteriota bacterium]|nr:efflux RND transporter periplasmic adaptor subunit [Acidobacteriota bacterium]